MSITDELRKWGRATLADTSLLVRMEAIADRIDAAVDGMIELPKDADGEYIHVGDVMEWPDGETFDVIGIGDGVLFYTESECGGPAEWTGASNKRHHHAPTVEDVLREFGIDWEHESDCEDRAALLKFYAAKLKLAESEDA